MLLSQAEKELELKDQDIMRLTKEVVELRLFKAALSTQTPVPQSSDETDSKEIDDDNKELKPDAGPSSSSIILDNTTCDLPSSLADSGHFEDIATSSVSLVIKSYSIMYVCIVSCRTVLSGLDCHGLW